MYPMLLISYSILVWKVVWKNHNFIIIGFENNNVNEQTNDASTFVTVEVTECY